MAKTKVDIVSGFLGAGKTTFIKKLIGEAIQGEQTVLIENEFGEIGIDGGFLKDSGIEIKEMNSGCICCSLAGDFATSLKEILTKFKPDRIIIEPSGVGKLSDVMKAVADVEEELEVEHNCAVTVVDVKKCKMYMKNFGEFFNNQIQFAGTIILSRADIADQKKIDEAVALIRNVNPTATIITTPITELTGEKLLEVLESPVDLKKELLDEMAHEHDHHHHEHDHDCDHDHHHHEHDHDHHEHDHDCDHDHHHHDHDHDHDHHEHDHDCDHDHHHHDHDHECHDEHCTHDHHHHHADDVFDSVGFEQVPAITKEKLTKILTKLKEGEEFGTVLRAKGMIADANSKAWFYFDLVPEEIQIRQGEPDVTGKVCVIGTDLKAAALEKEFRG
jgi:hypothetical protein